MRLIINNLMQSQHVQNCQKFFSDILASELVQKIKKTAISLFLKIAEIFIAIKKFSESNLKTFGLICCFTLVIVLFISILRSGNSKMVPFNTPNPTEKNNPSNDHERPLNNPNTKKKLNFDN